jgi:predicted metal-dependent hydrolase
MVSHVLIPLRTSNKQLLKVSSEIQYRIIFSRRRSISLIVSPDKGVVVRAPYRTSLRSIDRFVQEKESWVRKHIEKHSELTRVNTGKKYTDGESHLYMGKEYYLKIVGSDKLFVRQYDNIIEAGTNDTGDILKIKVLLEIWYRKKAQEVFGVMLEELLSRFINYRFSPTGFAVRPLKSRWGSCSSGGRITISSELIKLDPRYAEYVIVHELCHLKHHNHGKEFYRLLEELIPDYKGIRKELRQYLTR